MGMTPYAFFETFVEGNMWDCYSQPGDVRRAFNAAVSASHFADQYYMFNKRHKPDLISHFSSIGEFVEHLSLHTDGAFRDIRSISNAYKHLYTDTSGAVSAFSTINSSGAIEEVQFQGEGELRTIEENWSGSAGKDHKGAVVYTRKDGSTAEFLSVLEKVVDYLGTWARKGA